MEKHNQSKPEAEEGYKMICDSISLGTLEITWDFPRANIEKQAE